MAENLRVTRYNNGETIPNEMGDWTWVCLSCGVYCNYNNNSENDSTYGKLYNWSAISDSFHHICPSGWHVPSNTEWATLAKYLTDSGAGGKLKEAENTHWKNPNTGATNESGFTALPGGYRFEDGTFGDLGSIGYWWTSSKLVKGSDRRSIGDSGSPDPPDPQVGWPNAFYSSLHHNLKTITAGVGSINNGYSVRCVKD